MGKSTARNVLLVIGMWTFSRVIASVLQVLVALIKHQATFRGDAGTVMMWLWNGFPNYLVAALAAIALVWAIETRKPWVWLTGLAALYLYGGALRAWRILSHGWYVPPRTSDYIGILIEAIMPALACLIAGVWWTRRSATLKAIAA